MESSVAVVLNNLAEKLGTTAEYLFGILVRQAPLDGIVTTIQFVMIVLLWVAAYKILRNYKTVWEWAENNDLEPPLIIGGIFVAVVLLVLTIISFCYLPIYAASFFNPEYWALNEIMSALKRK